MPRKASNKSEPNDSARGPILKPEEKTNWKIVNQPDSEEKSYEGPGGDRPDTCGRFRDN
jgi:hypothetical protein